VVQGIFERPGAFHADKRERERVFLAAIVFTLDHLDHLDQPLKLKGFSWTTPGDFRSRGVDHSQTLGKLATLPVLAPTP